MLRGGLLVVLMIAVQSTTAGAQTALCDGVQPTIVGTDGDDVIDGTSGPDVIVAGPGNDTVRGFGSNDRICGGPGDDTLDGGDGDDRVFGGAGRDTLSDPDGTNTLDGGDGDDDIALGNGFDTVRGRTGNDVIKTSVGVFRLNGGEGIDTIDASTLDVDFNSRPDEIPEGVTIDLTTGSYEYRSASSSIAGIESIIGTVGSDTLTGDDGPNFIDGGWCDDVITGNGGDDILEIGTQDGTADGTPIPIQCLGSAPALSSLYGGDGDDEFRGNLGIADGGAGDDEFRPYTSRGVYVGGSGFDIVDYSGRPDLVKGVIVDLQNGTAIKKVRTRIGEPLDLVPDQVDEMEQVTGTRFADHLEASSAGSVLVGGNGDDDLLGDSGADTLRPGKGSDDVDGGTGPDILDYSDLVSAVSVDLRAGSAISGADTDSVVRVETVIGTGFGDTLLGDNRPNYLQGGDGNDLLQGRGANDVLDGGSGTDRCAGGAGTDAVLACEQVTGVP